MIKHPDRFSVRKRIKSFAYAFNGLKSLVVKEHNARIQIFVLVCVIGAGIYFDLTINEWIAIAIVSGVVILSELFNTAIERLADFVEPKRHAEIGLIKDYCAGAVLISAMMAAIVGGLIFLPKVLDLIKSLIK